MIGLRLSVPIACWRKGHARELIETEALPPPATAYGALLSLIGETNRQRHLGARVTTGMFNQPQRSQVLRTVWRIKNQSLGLGRGANAKPDFQQLLTNADVLILVDVGDEAPAVSLESRVKKALKEPDGIERFGGWCLGESTNLINDVHLVDTLVDGPLVFLQGGSFETTLPVWVDHVGSEGTRYATGALERCMAMPAAERVPLVVS